MCAKETDLHPQSAVSSRKETYNGIDLIKFICAILVFAIHIPPFPVESSTFSTNFNIVVQSCIGRLAVPFFFVSSGFLLFKKAPLYSLDTDIIKEYCFKLLRLTAMWSILLIFGGAGHLWYLSSTVVGIALLGLCLHFRIKLKYLWALAFPLYLIGLLFDSYYGLIAPFSQAPILKYVFTAFNMVFGVSRNGIFMGYIFVLMGATFSQNKINLKPWQSLIGFVVSLMLMLCELFLLKQYNLSKDYNMFVFLLPATFFLFSFARALHLKDRPIYKQMRVVGVLVYFLHQFVNFFVSLCVKFLYKISGIEIRPFQFLISLFATMFIAFCIERLSHKEKCKWINWFLS